jgi:Ca-activated chloride channel family protein
MEDMMSVNTMMTMIAVFVLVLVITLPLVAYENEEEVLSPGMRVELGDYGILLPLVNTSVRGEIEGFVAHIRVTQTFVNPYDDFIEATYVFPLPQTAAVNGMVMHLKNRDVIAKIQTREDAQRIYEEAVSTGRTAALLNQERPNIFTQKVGNIPPGDTIDVELTYIEALPYERGVSSFVFPTVVGPRYIPGQPLDGADKEPSGRHRDTTSVPDASRITPPSFDEGEVGPHRIDLELWVKPGLPIRSLHSPSHEIEIDRLAGDKAIVRIARTDTIPNKDFVLQTDLRGSRPRIAVLAHRERNEKGYVTVAIQPPALPRADEIASKDLFFVVDNSGSMSGQPIEAAKALVIRALNHMNPDDRFTIMRFSDSVSTLSPEPLENNSENVRSGVEFIRKMNGMGGTEMLSGIRRALEGKPETGRIRIVFFLTDGYIGNDDEILAAVKNENQSNARLFSLGVGTSVNRYLLSSMARIGRGEMQVMGYDEEVEPFVNKFYERVRNPVLTDVRLSWNGLSVSEQSPRTLPDLFDGQPIVVHARYEKGAVGHLTIDGNIGKRPWSRTVEVGLPEEENRPSVSNLWARAKIGEWSDEETTRPGTRRDEIVSIAMTHNLMSQYTSFVAVDREIVRPPREALIPVAQRLPLPDGVSRRALVSLSRYEIPPGDPFIETWAPSNSHRVTAIFPFGLIKDLTYDEARDKWRGRFLVPAGIEDGYYSILIGVETDNGQLKYRRETYHLDSEVKEFKTNFDTIRVRAGKGLTLEVDAIEPAAEVYVHCDDLGWERLALVSPDEGRGIDWNKWLRVPKDTPPGTYMLLVVVRDTAGNRVERELTLEVY